MIEPYYQDDYVTIYNADCRDVLGQLEPVDLVLTDPPFFMPATHYQSRVKWQRTWGDTSILRTFWSAVLDAVVPKLKRTGHFLTFCNHEVWRNQHELVIAARWDTAEFNEDGKLRSDVLRCRATLSADREHPVEKPLGLLSALMQPTVPKGGTVLDLFAGSGTTLLAAKALGLKAIGIEIEKRYCDIAIKRLRQESLLPLMAAPSVSHDGGKMSELFSAL